MLASVIIRTYNEEKYLPRLLDAVTRQDTSNLDVEIVLVDSGSTDNTLSIANSYGARIFHIQKQEFTFGRSLNIGCDGANGDFLLFISGHCIPVETNWAYRLTKPLIDGVASYSYGRQIGVEKTKYSEHQVFKKFYPENSKIPQDDYFCNNANAAVPKEIWQNIKFDEELTGLEDMFFAKELTERHGKKVAYTSDAPVYHIHEETWKQVKLRYEREAIALQKIMPNVHITYSDFLRYFLSSVSLDIAEARKEGVLIKNLKDIVLFRFMQFWGTYTGNHDLRKLSASMKENYFYPK
jgi:glycosyltransferase involved in cell wall biosynthesis